MAADASQEPSASTESEPQRAHLSTPSERPNQPALLWPPATLTHVAVQLDLDGYEASVGMQLGPLTESALVAVFTATISERAWGSVWQATIRYTNLPPEGAEYLPIAIEERIVYGTVRGEERADTQATVTRYASGKQETKTNAGQWRPAIPREGATQAAWEQHFTRYLAVPPFEQPDEERATWWRRNDPLASLTRQMTVLRMLLRMVEAMASETAEEHTSGQKTEPAANATE